MMLNTLYVVLEDGTREYLQRMMGAAPDGLNLDFNPKIELFTSPDTITPDKRNIYNARSITFDMWYSGHIQATSGLIVLDSPSMESRYTELLSEGQTPAWPYGYHPHYTLIPFVPPLKRHVRAWLNSISNTLAESDTPLIFGNEQVEVVEYTSPPNYEFNMIMDSR
jgi:hypothetical protein